MGSEQPHSSSSQAVLTFRGWIEISGGATRQPLVQTDKQTRSSPLRDPSPAANGLCLRLFPRTRHEPSGCRRY